MTETVSEKKSTTKSEQWRERLTAQEQRVVCEGIL
jgi:hypothetical protein